MILRAGTSYRLMRRAANSEKRGTRQSMRAKWFGESVFQDWPRSTRCPLRKGDRVRRTLGFCVAMGIDLRQWSLSLAPGHCAEELHEVGIVVRTHGSWLRVQWPSWPRLAKVARENLVRVGDVDPTQDAADFFHGFGGSR